MRASSIIVGNNRLKLKMINLPPTSKLEMYVLQSQILIEIEHENQEQSDHIIGLKGYNYTFGITASIYFIYMIKSAINFLGKSFTQEKKYCRSYYRIESYATKLVKINKNLRLI